MSMTGEVAGVVLAYVTREIIGDIKTTKTSFDPIQKENVKEEALVVDPVIVFFPNRTTQVLPRNVAEQKGFLSQPEVLNFSQVQDQKTPAGRYKNALREVDRKQAWLDMEQAVITGCVSASGHPLPREAMYNENSIFLD
jgi:hypothetical protein